MQKWDSTNSDEQALLRALMACPEDNTTRLVYADWLQDRGDSRSEFLRWEVAHHEEPQAALLERLNQFRQNCDIHWLSAVDRPLPGWRIVQEGTRGQVFGRTIPAFIHNGSHYYTPIHNGSHYYTPIDVYADGLINCWGFVDIPLFRKKLTGGWVLPRATEGCTISIDNLGQARVVAADWQHATHDLEQLVMNTIREFNPAMEGLLDMQGSDVEIRDGMRYAKGSGWGSARAYRVTETGERVFGDQLAIFEPTADGYRLRHWMLYSDGLTQLGYGNPCVTIREVEAMFQQGRLTLSVPEGAWLTLDGLGRFQAGEGYWWISWQERIREAEEMIEQLQGKPPSNIRCLEALKQYEAAPNDENREALRTAYLAVPEHLRMFCGDMDSKDWPIRQILGLLDEDEDEETE